MAKFYRDEQGNLYSVDRETGDKTLIQPAETLGDQTGEAGPDNVSDETNEDS